MLYAEHVARTFGNLDVLKDATFNVSEGERAGLVGPNGAGKSTLLPLMRARVGIVAGRWAT